MKISLAWLFDHLDGDWRKIDVQYLVQQFNLKVAEIESFEKIELKHHDFTVAKLKQEGLECVLFSFELQQEIILASRIDLNLNSYYLLKKLDHGWTWACGTDVFGQKDNLLPELHFASDQAASRWYEQVDLVDYILEVDNKSLTHRPDMWGHRGFAREIAILLDLNLLPDYDFFADLPVQKTSQEVIKTSINTPDCKSLATLHLPNIVNLPSQLNMALRLFRVDMRAINYLVDLTNYVMLDIGQPMHAFDFDLLFGRQLVVRKAASHEKLKLLGDQELQLDEHDIVIADGHGPISLAGIRGGLNSGTSMQTTNLLLESASFDATVIRRSAARHKIRTESSARYEKTLDPSQTVFAILRFIKLYQAINPNIQANLAVVSLGEPVILPKLVVSHEFIEKKLGVKIDPEFVIKVLTKLGFVTLYQAASYHITVPSWRASKDISLPIDIVEEVARLFGYDQITPLLPSKVTQPGSLDVVFRIRQIKQLLASFGMHEVENYPFYDESFLQSIAWQPQQAVEVRNPVSENWRRLVTSLIPHLCKNVQQESREYSKLRYFEFGRIWYPKNSESAIESRALAGVFFSRDAIDFYECKNYLTNLFNLLGLPITWQKQQQRSAVWYHPYQTAGLFFGGQQIGTAGKLSAGWMQDIAQGEAFGFEIDGDFILHQAASLVSYKSLSRFQTIFLDISLFVPLATTVSELQNTILQADARIYKVELADSFKKDDWLDKKALTFRYFFVDQEKTLSGVEIATIQQQVELAILKNGASVR
jgi:phenylalanyl-tRNA synthetase beta chain